MWFFFSRHQNFNLIKYSFWCSNNILQHSRKHKNFICVLSSHVWCLLWASFTTQLESIFGLFPTVPIIIQAKINNKISFEMHWCRYIRWLKGLKKICQSYIWLQRYSCWNCSPSKFPVILYFVEKKISTILTLRLMYDKQRFRTGHNITELLPGYNFQDLVTFFWELLPVHSGNPFWGYIIFGTFFRIFGENEIAHPLTQIGGVYRF